MHSLLRPLLAALLIAPLAAWAADKHSAEDIKKDIERHRQMAAAHEGAARCLAAGQPVEQCQKALQAACKGLAIGKYCGMRHQH